MAPLELCPGAGLNRVVSENLIKSEDPRESGFSSLGSCNYRFTNQLFIDTILLDIQILRRKVRLRGNML